MLILAGLAIAGTRCDVTYEEPGATLRFLAWGADEGAARRAGAEDGRLLGALGLLVDARDPARISARIATRGTAGVPGVNLVIGPCRRDADVDKPATVRFADAPPLTRSDGAAARQSARRGCLARMEAAVDGAIAHPDELGTRLDAMRSGVHACWVATPVIDVADARAPTPAKYVCTAWTADPGVRGVAWGDSLDAARDAAEARRASVRAGMAAGILTAGVETAAVPTSLVLGVLTRVAEAFAHSDRVERSRTTCASIPASLRLTWEPDPVSVGVCRVMPMATRAGTTADAEGAIDEVCDAAYADYPNWSVTDAPGRVAGEATFCAASCRSATRAEAAAFAPLPDVPDRSTEAAARARLAEAVATRDFELASIVLPELDGWLGRQTLIRAPDQLWSTLATPDALRWTAGQDGWSARTEGDRTQAPVGRSE